MATLKTPSIAALPKFFQSLDPISKWIFVGLGVASISLLGFASWRVVVRLTAPQITIAAGDKEGESYIISNAIAKVIQKRSNIRVTVLDTGGTKENLELLQQGKAQLATAQADVVTEDMDAIANTKANSSKSSLRTLAVLYKDLFQLLVRDSNLKQFVQLKGKTVALPVEGGQYQSFEKIAKHYRLVKLDIFPSSSIKSDGFRRILPVWLSICSILK